MMPMPRRTDEEDAQWRGCSWQVAEWGAWSRCVLSLCVVCGEVDGAAPVGLAVL